VLLEEESTRQGQCPYCRWALRPPPWFPRFRLFFGLLAPPLERTTGWPGSERRIPPFHCPHSQSCEPESPVPPDFSAIWHKTYPIYFTTPLIRKVPRIMSPSSFFLVKLLSCPLDAVLVCSPSFSSLTVRSGIQIMSIWFFFLGPFLVLLPRSCLSDSFFQPQHHLRLQ